MTGRTFQGRLIQSVAWATVVPSRKPIGHSQTGVSDYPLNKLSLVRQNDPGIDDFLVARMTASRKTATVNIEKLMRLTMADE